MKKTTKGMVGAAAGVAATGAALAAYYLYGSEHAAKHRRDLKAWSNKAERDIVREAKKFKEKALTDANINTIITTVARQYEATKDLDASDVRDFVSTMKSRWQSAKKSARGKQKKAVVGARKKKA